MKKFKDQEVVFARSDVTQLRKAILTAAEQEKIIGNTAMKFRVIPFGSEDRKNTPNQT